MYKVLLVKKAVKDLDSLPVTVVKRVASALDELSSLGIKSSNVKKLHIPLNGYRKRVGDYRILFDVDEDFILVHRICKRSDAYR